MQVEKIEVSYTLGGKAYSFSPNGLKLKVGDMVIVDTSRGNELGYVCSNPIFVDDLELVGSLKNVIRLANENDIKKHEENIEKQKEIVSITEELANSLNLDMKIVSAELDLDRSKVTINFTSDDRVDFRELVKKLALTLKTRIELRQIGARNETQMLGGLGPCGRQVCCNLFLKDFEHSTIKMAKNQGLSLNPTNISGLCGKLKCCLAYENDGYVEILKQMPKINSIVKTPDGEGQVVYNNLLKKLVQVKFTKGDTTELKEYELDKIKFNSDERK